MRPPAASKVTLRTNDGRSTAKRQAASNPVAEGMADQVCRTAIHGFQHFGDVDGQIVQCRAVERAATLSDTAHVNGDGLQPSGTECARQVVKITDAAAGVREQHDRGARPAKGALERRAADLDVSVLLQAHSRESADVRYPKHLVAGRSPS